MKIIIPFLISILIVSNSQAQRTVINLEKNWKFSKGNFPAAINIDFNDTDWETVTVPHDWAIYGPFDKEVDKQVIAIVQNNEKVATEKTGRTGALPFIGVGWYRTEFSVPGYKQGKKVLLTFDGAMSEAQVFVNGKKVGERPYGYSYFYFDITSFLNSEGNNLLAVRLENQPQSSRWYPGAGIYRKVQIIVKNDISLEHWGTFITTPYITDEVAKINVKTELTEQVSNLLPMSLGSDLRLETEIRDANGKLVAKVIVQPRLLTSTLRKTWQLSIQILWSPENPYLYSATLRLFQNNVLKDEQTIRFGIRKIEYLADKGFLLNGEVTKFKGVCLHHDLGPLGSAINKRL
jgi:beta-galactosidase